MVKWRMYLPGDFVRFDMVVRGWLVCTSGTLIERDMERSIAQGFECWFVRTPTGTYSVASDRFGTDAVPCEQCGKATSRHMMYDYRCNHAQEGAA